jgi:hypothetical protein
VLGLGSGQRIEVGGRVEGMPRGADRRGQRCFRQPGLISHSAIIATGQV